MGNDKECVVYGSVHACIFKRVILIHISVIFIQKGEGQLKGLVMILSSSERGSQVFMGLMTSPFKALHKDGCQSNGTAVTKSGHLRLLSKIM